MTDDRLANQASPVVLGPPTGWPRNRRRRRTGRLAGWAPPLVMFGVFVGIWYLISEVVLDDQRRFLLPPPDDVVAVAFLNPVNRASLLDGLALSTGIAMAGLAIATVLGLAIGIAMSQARWVERTLYPYAVVLQCIPTLALVPVIGFWFDFGLASRLIVTVAIAVFPVISSTLFGLQSADRSQHDLLTLHRAGRLTRLIKLQLPNAMPAILTGLQVAATLAVVGAVVGDFFFRQGDAGIGVLIDLYRARLQSEQLFGAAILACLLGVVVFSAFGLLNRLVTGGWYGSTAYDAPRRP
jgi:NitT/TauT family transport system permease protein